MKSFPKVLLGSLMVVGSTWASQNNDHPRPNSLPENTTQQPLVGNTNNPPPVSLPPFTFPTNLSRPLNALGNNPLDLVPPDSLSSVGCTLVSTLHPHATAKTANRFLSLADKIRDAIIQWVEAHGTNKWYELEEQLKNDPNSPNCSAKNLMFFDRLIGTEGRKKTAWDDLENQTLALTVSNFGNRFSWVDVSNRIPGRTSSQCKNQYERLTSVPVRGNPFSEVEDKAIRHWVDEQGAKNWMGLSHRFFVATHLPNRSAAQLSSRYFNVLDPNIKWEPFSADEDAIIRAFVLRNDLAGNAMAAQIKRDLHITRTPRQCLHRFTVLKNK